MQLVFTSAAPTASTLTVINGTVNTGYVLTDFDFGNAAWAHAFSGVIGTQGARPAHGVPQNRSVKPTIRAYGTSKDDCGAKLAALERVVDEMRRFGGTILWQSNNQTYRQTFNVLTAAAGGAIWGNRAENMNVATIAFDFTCGPYALGDPMSVKDTFATDTVAAGDWTLNGAAGISSAGGKLSCSSGLSATKLLSYTRPGYQYGDVMVRAKFDVGAVRTGFTIGCIVSWTNANNYLVAQATDDGTNTKLQIIKVVAGASTTLVTVNQTTRLSVSAGQPFSTYWLRAWNEGPNVTAELWATEPTPTGTPDMGTAATWSLAPADAVTFATGIVGLLWVPKDATADVLEFAVRPYWYKSRLLPDELQLQGAVPGDSPALCDLDISVSANISPPDTGVSRPPVWGAFAAIERPPTWNLLQKGNDATGWLTTTMWGVTSALGAIASVNLLGQAMVNITTTNGASGEGASYRVYRPFRKGWTYTATALVTASVAASWKLSVGNSGSDFASTTFTTSTSGYVLITTTWTPTADYNTADVVFADTTATANVVSVRSLSLYENPTGTATAPTLATQTNGKGGLPPFGILQAENAATMTNVHLPITTDGASLGGFQVPISTATPMTLQWLIDPSLAFPDDYTQGAEVDVEVFVRLNLLTLAVGVSATISAYPEGLVGGGSYAYGAQRTQREAAHTITSPLAASDYGIYRVGTLPLYIDRANPLRWLLQLDMARTDTNQSVGVDYLLLLPARRRIAGPTAKTQDSTYPKFVPTAGWNTAVEITKTLRRDGTALIRQAPLNGYPDHGFGMPLEVPAGNVNLIAKLSSVVPDEPTVNGSGLATRVSEQLQHPCTVHASITPRWAIIRDA